MQEIHVGEINNIYSQNRTFVVVGLKNIDGVPGNHLSFSGFLIGVESIKIGDTVYIEGIWTRHKLYGSKIKGLMCINESRFIKQINGRAKNIDHIEISSLLYKGI
jgi:hypothetical protein